MLSMKRWPYCEVLVTAKRGRAFAISINHKDECRSTLAILEILAAVPEGTGRKFEMHCETDSKSWKHNKQTDRATHTSTA